MNRRSVLTGTAALAVTGAVPAVAAAHPDSELIAACAAHPENIRAYNAIDGDAGEEHDNLWAAYERTRDLIGEAQPETLVGMLAKARAAKAEALNLDGEEWPSHTPAETWAWDLVNDLLRLAAI